LDKDGEMTERSMNSEGHAIKSEDFSKKSLERRAFTSCSFNSCDFSESILRNAKFSACTFINCNLSLAKLDGCRFQDAQFIECKIVGAEFFNSPYAK
jgi:fluoroquinolone resistance protein